MYIQNSNQQINFCPPPNSIFSTPMKDELFKMEIQKVAVVTGSNKGIGFAIVKGLCEKFNGRVYLTARNVTNGNNAVTKLKQLGLNPLFHQLDVCNENSINSFAEYIRKTEGGIDILINNAAIYMDKLDTSMGNKAEESVRGNYYSVLNVCKSLFCLLRSNAQVINVSSSAGHLARIPSFEIQAKLRDPQLTVEKLNELMEEYVEDCKNNSHIEKGWGSSPYVVSKVGVSTLSIIQQREFDKDEEMRNVSVNFIHPGYVDTDMTNHQGVLTTEEGAKSSLYLALGNHKLRGKFVWFDCSVVDWYGPTTPPK